MLIPSNDVTGVVTARVVVIGAGPAGMALALALSRLGVDVVVLSSGGVKSDDTLNDLSRATALPEGHADPVSLSARRFGGLSWAWGGRCVAPDLMDFTPRPALGLPGWPIGYDEVTQHMADAADFLGITPSEFDTTDDSLDRLERWASEPHLVKRHMPAFKSKTGPRVLLDMTCTAARFDHFGHVSELEAKTRDAREITIRAERFVIAAGGLETARLLLWFFQMNGQDAPGWTGRGYMGHLKGQILKLRGSQSSLEPLDYHVSGSCYVRRRMMLPQADLDAHGLPNTGFCLDNPHLSDASHGDPGLSLAYLGLSMPVLGAYVTSPAMRLFFTDTSRGSRFDHFKNVARNPLQAAGYCLSVLRQRRKSPVRPSLITQARGGWHKVTFYAEERPQFQNGVTLSEERDRFGIPRSSIRRQIDPRDIQGAIAANLVLGKRLASQGFETEIESREEDMQRSIQTLSADGYHQIGTARMGSDAESSVTDANCRVHGTRNLYVAGSAVFPRSGQANPTLLVVCLAKRLAKHLSAIS